MRIFFVLPFFILLLGVAYQDNRIIDKNKVTNRQNVNLSKSNSNPKTNANLNSVPTYTYEVIKEYRHDNDSFTQGLVVHNGWFYESSGQYGDSGLRRIDIETGKVKQKRNIEDGYFAEGLTILNGKIYQLTWREQVCFVYDLEKFNVLQELNYNGEGWGLTNDGTNLIMSDGTHLIRFLDPNNLRILRTISVLDNGQPLMKLNELEYVKGEIWANIWYDNRIVRINPNDGKILGWIDLTGIIPKDADEDDGEVLNGIAYDAAGDRLFVTGKRWRKLFEIKIKPKA
jgi:glutamine cyclotransferase